MEQKICFESQFYVDDITRALSEKYDVKSYKAPLQTLGDASIECKFGRFMFLAKMCGEFVGVDINTYKKKFSGEQWYDLADPLREGDLEYYAKRCEEKMGAQPLRIEEKDGKKIYFPTEDLISTMLKGIYPLPPWLFAQLHQRRN